MKELFDKMSIRCSRLTTHMYSTSFSLGIQCLDRELRDPVYAIYGFVRFADEIVDSFHAYDKPNLLERFKKDTYCAIAENISLNPILNSFQATVNKYGIEHTLIEQFMHSMELDLSKSYYTADGFKNYILGSAEVVGLMCLRIFCNHDDRLYIQLKPYAMRLGSAFQKVNFLRDLKVDYIDMGRTYFPGVDMRHFDEENKKKIEDSIEQDFDEAYKGIKQLPRTARFGVYVAYVYYTALFKKIRSMPSHHVLKSRIRIGNSNKARLLAYSFVKHQLNLL